MSVESLKVQIINKAWEDEAFKQQLLADPKAAIQGAFGVELPDAIEVKVVEESPGSYYLVIPPKPEELGNGDSGVEVVW